MKQKFYLILIALIGLLGNSARVWAQDVPEPTAQWSFNNAEDLMAPDKGSLTMTPAVLGSKSITLSTLSGAGITQTDGPADGNKAILVPAASALKVARPEGSEATEEYTLLMDISVSNASPYNGLFQTKEENDNDGDLFIHDNKIGVASLGGYFGNIQDNTWYRVVLTYHNGKNTLYVDGNKLVSHDQDENHRFKIEPFGFYLFCDESGEKQDTYVSQVAFWEAPLTDAQVIELGSVVPPVVTEIATAEDLVAFAEYVKEGEGNEAAHAVLTADITLTEPWVTPIGIDGTPYSGIFDGQGYSITGFNGSSAGKFGLFGVTKNAIIKNFSIDGSLTVTAGTGSGVVGWTTGSTISNVHSTLTIAVTEGGTHHVAGVVGSAQGNNTISGCTWDGSMTVVTGNNDNFAGIVSYLGGDYVEYCTNYGDITYADTNCAAGGIAGYLNNTGSTVKGCLNMGTLTCEDSEGTPTFGSAIVGRLRNHDANKLTGNCWLEGSAYGAGRNDSGVDVLAAYCFTSDQLSTGAVCYALNGDQSEIGWYQTLGTDEAPVLDASHGQVYMVGRLHCNGDAYGDATYTNTYTEVTQDDHNVVDGFCDYCGLFFEDGLTPNADGFYEIANAKQLTWFSMKINKGTIHANAILTADIDFAELMPEDADPEETEIVWTAIGDWNTGNQNTSAFGGHFDGQGHKILHFNTTANKNFFGLFGVITTGCLIENFTIYGTINTGYQYTGPVAAYARDDELAIKNVQSYVDINNTYAGGRQGGILGGAHGTMTIVEGCSYFGTLSASDAGGSGNYGGIIGYVNNSTSTYVNITNCLFNGTVINSNETPGNCTFGGFIGYSNSGIVTIKNCLSIGTVESAIWGQYFGAVKSTQSSLPNSYYIGEILNGSASTVTLTATETNTDQLSSGEICWLLNEESFIDPAWYQTLDEDANPLPFGDGKIVYQTKDGDYENIDPATLTAFINDVIAKETEFLEQTVAYQVLTDAYAEEIKSWENIETLEEFLEAYKAAAELKESIKTSAANYVAYVQACEDAADYITTNKLKGATTDILKTYLETEEEPGESYPNGSYVFIMDNLNLDDEAIAAEIIFVNQMLEAAIAADGIIPGNEITRLLVNPDFATEDFEGWTVEYEGGKAVVGGTTNIMPVAESFNNKSFNASQTLTDLPNGIYMMALNGLFRAGWDVTSQFYAGQLYLNDTYNYFMSPSEDIATEEEAELNESCIGHEPDDKWCVGKEKEGWVPNMLYGCSVAFNAGRYQNFVATEVTDGNLTVGTRTLGTGLTDDWMPFGNLHVFYLGTAEEADAKLAEVLEGYKARAQVIVDFEPSDDSNDFTHYPSMSEELKEQLVAAIAAVGQAEDKMALINTFSDLFNQTLACRKAYIEMLTAANKLYDLLGELDAEGLVSDEDFAKWDNEITAAQNHYNNGDITTEEALAIAEELNNVNLIDVDIVDGVYQLATGKDLVLFSKIVNSGMNTSDAVLVNDIDMGEYGWGAPIGFWGSNSIGYKGHFDGQGHTITNFNFASTQNFYGLFGVLSTDAIVENFTIYGEIDNAANQQYMGVIGYARDENVTIRNINSHVDFLNAREGGRQGGILGCASDGQTTIERCTYSGKFHSTDAGGSGNYGGIVGYANNNPATVLNITNCLFDGELVNTAEVPGNCTFGGMVGYANSATVTIQNCLSIGTVQSPKNGQFFGALNGGNSKIYNSYYQGEYINGSSSGRTATPQQATSVTDAQLASGEICYKLNGDQTDINWYQTLATDDHPVLFGSNQIVWLYNGNYINIDPDAINDIQAAEPVQTGIYNLAGQRISKLQKGINIVNGKKIAVK